ncbi:MAG: tRNA 2-thiouridine(34) synthase MnmA [Candidatus Cloacimonetes bacterium]|jgi:tRNA-specific 2-thiouridylase|nr:tRNA 2-thiouridine(34) synthase MnmA [Candidatus Cloacimonadota bacterium]MDY0173005.1 tRNA 2-thiouridine(34) synthase MnmA [Candidatus Cloacimonadaceae bacterium]
MKIALGLSGGIDSAMCALMLLQQGHEVIGLTMTKWSPCSGIDSADKRGCYGPNEPAALATAIESAAKLGIEHHIINLEEEFSRIVLNYYTESYVQGRTPNPCVVCNHQIKFGALIQKARDQGILFDKFATGHYARTRYHEPSQRWQLLAAADPLKDQSYFLSMLTQEQLALCLFPLGEMKKSELKEFARAQGYEYLVKKRESQDFLQSSDSSPLFQDYLIKEGDFVDLNMKVLGRHKGLIHYTIGQRRNLGLAGFAEAQYVLALDTAQNRVIIGPERHLYHDSLFARFVNWISIPEPETALFCSAKIRLAQDPVPCRVEKVHDGSYYVCFESPVSAITPGQVVTFYDGDLVLGAGFIS